MTGRCHMQIPIPAEMSARRQKMGVGADLPCGANERGLGIEGAVPDSHAKLKPTFRIDWAIDFPKPPRVEVFLRHLLRRTLIPHAAPVGTNFDANGPAAAAICPPSAFDVSVVHDLRLVDGRHDG